MDPVGGFIGLGRVEFDRGLIHGWMDGLVGWLV